LLALQPYLPYGCGELPFGKSIVGRRYSLPRPVALGTAWRRFRGRADQRIGSRMLLQKPAGEFLAQGTGSLLALCEGDQLLGLGAAKHLIKGGHRLLDPLPSQVSASASTAWLGAFHGRFSC
jgi:hypothetical protein